jgi:hypothetical protein
MLAAIAVVAFPSTASAATTQQVILHADGNVAGEAWWNSGRHADHTHGQPGYGFNAFTITDQFCGDGWGVGVVWTLEGIVSRKQSIGDCDPEEIRYETDQATAEMQPFQWRIYMWNTNNPAEKVYADEFRYDWMGSLARCASTWINEASVYNDYIYNHGVQTVTVSYTPKVFAPRPFHAWQEVLQDLDRCTPFRKFLNPTQYESVRLQLMCHTLFAINEDFGGPTWDFEASRPPIPWWRVVSKVNEHGCNW